VTSQAKTGAKPWFRGETKGKLRKSNHRKVVESLESFESLDQEFILEANSYTRKGT
jgi:hypothetical protein